MDVTSSNRSHLWCKVLGSCNFKVIADTESLFVLTIRIYYLRVKGPKIVPTVHGFDSIEVYYCARSRLASSSRAVG